MTKCRNCKSDLELIDIFPGGVCLDCYRVSTANDPLPTADELVRMWGGPVRRKRRR